MEQRSEAESTSEVKPTLVAVVEFADAAYYIHESVRDFDPDPLFAMSILHLLIKNTMAYAEGWVEDVSLDYAVNALEQTIPKSQEYAYEIARNAQGLIEQQLTIYFPDFSAARYNAKYSFSFIGETNGKIRIDYWDHGRPTKPPTDVAEALL